MGAPFSLGKRRGSLAVMLAQTTGRVRSGGDLAPPFFIKGVRRSREGFLNPPLLRGTSFSKGGINSQAFQWAGWDLNPHVLADIRS